MSKQPFPQEYLELAATKKAKQPDASDRLWTIAIVVGLIANVLALGTLAYFFLIPRITSFQSAFSPGDPTATPPGQAITDPNYQAGKTAYAGQRYQEVIDRMTPVINARPDLAPPYWYRGMANWYLGQNQAAMNDMQQALAIDPNYALAYADRGLVYSSLGDREQAMADWQRALALDPSLAKVHHNMGVIYFNEENYRQALQAYEQALAIDPGRAATWSDLAKTHYFLGELEKCIDRAGEAIRLQPDLWYGYYIRGTCYLLLKQYEAAITDLTLYIRAEPNDACGWQNRGCWGTGDRPIQT